jgi:hypothetical protein
MRWYVTSFVTHRQPNENDVPPLLASREYWCILTASDSNSAYGKALDIARRIVGELIAGSEDTWVLDGISELLMVAEPLKSGSEVVWEQQEISRSELLNRVKKKSELEVFAEPPYPRNISGWYVCKIALVEVHDTGSHGELALAWINWHLIQAENAESAYDSAADLGKSQESIRGSHRCNGDRAHWEFVGITDLIESAEPPRDGGTLWFKEFHIQPDQLIKLIPQHSELSVFEWEERGAGR